MTIRRNINGNIETIELTNVEMEKAFEIVREKDLREYFDFQLKSFDSSIKYNKDLYNKLFADYLSEWRNFNSFDDEIVFSGVIEKNKQLIHSFQNTRE